MQKGMVDVCITGTDRTTLNGDVCNKIGTYLKGSCCIMTIKFLFMLQHQFQVLILQLTDGLNNISQLKKETKKKFPLYAWNKFERDDRKYKNNT